MASADHAEGVGAGRRVWRFLAANDTGIGLLLVVAVLFVAGSIVRERMPGAYEGLRGDDIRFFFAHPRAIDLWFWAILLACAVLGLSLTCCTIDALRRRARMRDRDPRSYGTILAHVGAGVALIAHAVGGWSGGESFGMVGRMAVPVGDVRVRLLDTETSLYPDGAVRRQTAEFELTRPGSPATRVRCAPNDPARWAGGTEMLLLMGLQPIPAGCVLSLDGRIDTLSVGEARALGDGGRIVLERLFGPPEYRAPIARLRIVGGPREGIHLLSPGIASDAPGITLSAMRVDESAIVAHRHAPGTIWLLVGGIVFGAGILLSAARRLQFERERGEGRCQ